MPNLNESRHPGEFVLSEAKGQRSRENMTIAASQTIEANSILQKQAIVANVVATATVGGSNTGNATIVMDATATTTKVKDGRYKGIATAATAVSWENPSGKKIGISTHGELFDKGGIRVIVTAGGTPNVAGDEFYVDVAADAEDFQHVTYDPDSDLPIGGIAIYGATTGAGEMTKVAGIVRDAEANGHCIAWPAGITAPQKANATQELAELGIIVRS